MGTSTASCFQSTEMLHGKTPNSVSSEACKTMIDAETQYSKAEKIILALVTSQYQPKEDRMKTYREAVESPYLKCLSPTEALMILKQIHDEDYGNHSGGRSLAHRVLTQGYFWPYLARNAEEYARRYDKCQ
ncbi:uncharacterized protein LOC132266219 [Cornus florida]|uniref:uncharacterized protein LOC132266219 n=1 Tax=Cornus florida TaxID=4283 RepID=UPI0028A022CC|nr:uncharacterized protein LOC132266219 [Cornus florida]